MAALPVMRIMSVAGDSSRKRRNSASPSSPGSRMSATTTSNGVAQASSSASEPSAAQVTSCPSSMRASEISEQMSGSSSTTKASAFGCAAEARLPIDDVQPSHRKNPDYFLPPVAARSIRPPARLIEPKTDGAGHFSSFAVGQFLFSGGPSCLSKTGNAELTDVATLTAMVGQPDRGDSPIGAEMQCGHAHLRVWAPRRRRVAVVIDGSSAAGDSALGRRETDTSPAWRAAWRSGGATVSSGRRREALSRPGLALSARGTARAVGGDRSARVRLDRRRVARASRARGQVIYELHVGTFTAEGTYAAAAERLAVAAPSSASRSSR